MQTKVADHDGCRDHGVGYEGVHGIGCGCMDADLIARARTFLGVLDTDPWPTQGTQVAAAKVIRDLADALETTQTERDRLREALEELDTYVASPDTTGYIGSPTEAKVRAALADDGGECGECGGRGHLSGHFGAGMEAASTCHVCNGSAALADDND